MCGVVIDRLLSDQHTGSSRERLVRAEVAAPAGMCAGRDLQLQTMATLEAMGRGPHIDLDVQAAAGLRLTFPRLDAEQPVTDVDRAAVWMHVAQPSEKVGVARLDRTYSSNRTGPITSISRVSGGVWYVSTSGRASSARLSTGPEGAKNSGPPTAGVGSTGS